MSYESHFSQKTGVKNTFLFFYPSAKDRNELNIGEIVVTFQDASAHYAQKIVAPPKRRKHEKTLRLFEAVKTRHKFFFRGGCRRKMKCGESSETRFAKVSGRSEPCRGVNGCSKFDDRTTEPKFILVVKSRYLIDSPGTVT